ncbi:MAG: methyltransferase domain-containing protein [Candidatus Scalindua rubra]|uniref:Methyltransferase n=1 Tax=Candidatus Scalindua brodae TaxID=237368 RepID=A0A0B0ES80_9BACT|nr:MAG: methyltransferase [Candidatus Scalindua brodae]MBZ0108942.1 methyltransferase domain-containing protein [Candidatus Scalindua rubra]TWU32136.1 Demethylspheroidene O-methyltransferase [Candidatus Brocadiaceae bacterium S225]
MTNTHDSVDPSPIFKLSTAYWDSKVILTANRLNIFTLLDKGSLSCNELAQQCKSHPRSLAILLNACVGLELLKKEGNGAYSNVPATHTYLVKGKQGYLGDALKYSDDLFPVWDKLHESIQQNKPAMLPEIQLGDDPEKTRHFVMAMHNKALGIGRCFAEEQDITGRKKLLDVGGGPGTYSILLAQKTPGLTSTVLDLPGVLKISKEIIKSNGLEDRVKTVDGDYTRDAFPKGNDVVLLAGMLHRETPEMFKVLLKKAYDALQPGGMIILNDLFFENDNMDSPPFVNMFALTMLLTSAHGTIHSKTSAERWLSETGFSQVISKPLPPPMPHLVITALKKKD